MPSHDASASALGYMHQVLWGLVELLRTGPTRPDHGLMLEEHDDVSWAAKGEPTELLQLKHHTGSAGNLSDRSVDLWKSMKVWLDDPRFMAVDGPTLCLITTANAPGGSAASKLRADPETRDVTEALRQLDHAANESESKDTGPARKAWLATSRAERLGLIERLTILDASLKAEDLDGEIRRLLFYVAPRQDAQYELFKNALTGWWHAVALDMLSGHRGAITALQVQVYVEGLRDSYTEASLPTSAWMSADEEAAVLTDHRNRVFVQQLGWIDAHPRTVERAIIDFHRAVTQTTDWADRNLIEMAEFDRFKDSLADEWEYAYYDMLAELPEEWDDVAKRRAGRALFTKLRDSTSVKIRGGYSEPFYTRGVQYELADGGTHGWHADFEELIEKITLGADE
jgi:hypothetical protein